MLLVEHEAAFVEQHHHVGGALAFDGRGGLQQIARRRAKGGRHPSFGRAGGGVRGQQDEGQEQVGSDMRNLRSFDLTEEYRAQGGGKSRFGHAFL